MTIRGKRLKTLDSLVDRQQRYSVEEAVDLLKKTGKAGFDESIDVAVRLGVNPRHSDQMVRGACSLPHGTGRSVRILVFAEGEAAIVAKNAGADVVGGVELIAKIQKESWFEFDKAVAIRSMMPKVARLGRQLGPRGLMPNPKIGTVVDDANIAETVGALKRGKIDFRVEKAGIIHSAIGRASMETQQIQDNLLTLIATLVRLKPSTAKGTYIKGLTISTTMGPGIRVDTLDAQRASERY